MEMLGGRQGIGTYRDSGPFLRSIARPFLVLCLLWAVLAASQKAGARPRPWADNKKSPRRSDGMDFRDSN